MESEEYSLQQHFGVLLTRAQEGDASAQFYLGAMYARGRGVPKDCKEAAKWSRLAADQGHANAQVVLGRMYQRGWGVLKDNREAAKWYRKAADLGSAEAQNNLGVMCHNGIGVPQDRKEAGEWYRKAADQGNAKARANLGDAFWPGGNPFMDERIRNRVLDERVRKYVNWLTSKGASKALIKKVTEEWASREVEVDHRGMQAGVPRGPGWGNYPREPYSAEDPKPWEEGWHDEDLDNY